MKIEIQKHWIILFLIGSFLISCGDDEMETMMPEPEPTSSVPDCCALPAIIDSVGSGRIYVPNVFTPDMDGRNDRLIIFANSSIKRIASLVIRQDNGLLVYKAFDFNPNDPAFAWDGAVNGIIKRGLYEIKIIAENTNGELKSLLGKVCSFPCERDRAKEPAFDSIANCQLGSQHNGKGGFDVGLTSGEDWFCLE